MSFTNSLKTLWAGLSISTDIVFPISLLASMGAYWLPWGPRVLGRSAWFWLAGPRVLGRAGLAFIFRLDTAFIFRLDNSIIFRLATAIIFRLDTAIIFRRTMTVTWMFI